MRTLRAPSNPLAVLSERRWFILGSLLATFLVWTRVSNPTAWLGFLAVLGAAAAWIIYGSALSRRSRQTAVVVSAASMLSLLIISTLAVAALAYAEYTGAPGWVYAVIFGSLVAMGVAAAWLITAPLRQEAGR
jgi:drug/metabolite transporter (DMT)-like permease